MKLTVLLCALWLAGSVCAQPNTAAIEALSRLKGMDLEANPALKKAVLNMLDTTRGTPHFVEIVRDFNLKGHAPELLKFASENATNSTGIEALRLAAAETNNFALTAGLVEAMGNSGDKQFVPVLVAALAKTDFQKAALKALCQSEPGASEILKLAREEKLETSLKFTASALLNSVSWPAIKSEAAKVLPLPQSQNSSLPPVGELAKLKGDSANGAKVFRRLEVNCVGCHKVGDEGADFGPNLSEIGTKLAREALYESILDPTAGVSFGFEGWTLDLKNGDEVSGIITSDTPEEVALKTQTGISTKYKKSDIAKRTQAKLSLMPQGLQLAMSQQDLVDLVEYLAGLKKKN